MRDAAANDRRVIFAAVLLSSGIFVFDLSTPLGVAGAVPYVAVILISLWSSRRQHTLFFAAGTSLLAILGFFFSPQGGIPWVVYLNRSLALFVIWVTAFLSLSRKRIEEELQEHRLHLEDKVAERTAELERFREDLGELVAERTHELETAQTKLVRSERLAALGKLTATVAHEIRNPLGTVRNALFSMGDALKRGEMERLVRAERLAERNIQRCDRIITELLDFTRKRELSLHLTDMDSWLESIVEEFEFPEGLECRCELHSGIRLEVDREHLRRAVVNAVTNAIQALQEDDANGNRLTVETRAAENRLEIRFADTGPGIPEELRDRIFEPLFSTKSFGVGLGLSIIGDIMKEHGGGVECLSETGQGATMVLWLPIQREDA